MENKEIVLGRHPVLEYIRQLTDPKGATLFISKSSHGKIIDIIIRESRSKRIATQYCDKEFLSKFHASSKHQGVVLVTSRKKIKTSDKEFIDTVHHKGGVLVLLDQLTDPNNVGSIIRTIEALGGDGIIIPKSHSTDLSSVIKASAGATAYLRIITVPNIANFLETAKMTGFWIIGTSHKGDTELIRLKQLKPAIIIIGNEGRGMRRLTEEKCDIIVKIPLKGHISSLNASVAAGIVLYEALL